MEEYSFVVKIIDKNWFRQEGREASHGMSFREDITQMSERDIEKLLSLVFECLKMRTTPESLRETGKSIKAGDYSAVQLYDFPDEITIDEEFLSKFLYSIMFSEYGVSSILHYPTEMRFKRLKEISDSIGISEELFALIDSNWHGDVRKKVFQERS